MKRGRKPTATALLLIQGTFRPHRHRARVREPQAPAGPLDPPDYLTEGQRQAWMRVVRDAPAGVLAPIDQSLLFVYVCALDQFQAAARAQARQDQRRKLPLLVKGRDGAMAPSPYFKIMHQASQMILRAGSELGFTPSSRLRHGMPDALPPPSSDPDDPWQKLKRLQSATPSDPDKLH